MNRCTEEAMSEWYSLVSLLPFSWTEFDFMKNALLALIIVCPCFGLIGTLVVGNKMAFFSDVIGHSALTGIAIGVILGLADPRPAMLVFAVVLAILINIFSRATNAANDTVIGVFFAATVAVGVAVLSRGGSFNKFSVYLVGDILSLVPREIAYLALMLAAVILFWIFLANHLSLITVHASLARERTLSAFVVQTAFSALVAIVVVLSIRWVGILIINSLFILPAASARMISGSIKQYTILSVAISLASGIAGLMVSFYTGFACGATIVICATLVYVIIVAIRFFKRLTGTGR
jgi:zinc transport system permease protein